MTDKERLLALLEDFGITPKVSEDDHGVRLLAGSGAVEGHPYFFCDFDFNADDSFRGVGVWE